MPRLLRLSIMKAADSPLIDGSEYERVSSPPGSFSTLITSAPMSASSMPHVGPAMIWASSITLMPFSGPTASALLRRAADDVVVHEPGRLHEGIHDRRSHEGEAALLEVFREGVRFGRGGRHPLERAGTVALRLPADEFPNVLVEAAELPLDLEERAGVLHRARHLEAIAHDPGIQEQLLHLRGGEARDLRGIEAGEGLAVVLALGEDGRPG